MNQEQFYDLLDNSVQEDGCGQFRLSQSLPYGVDLLGFAVLCNVQGSTQYGQQEYGEALLWYTRILKLLGTYLMTQDERMMVKPSKVEIVGLLSEAYYNRANTHDELGNYDKALKDYECSLKFNNPQPWNVLLNRALVKEKLGRLNEAKEDLLDARSRAPMTIRGIENSLARIQETLSVRLTNPRQFVTEHMLSVHKNIGFEGKKKGGWFSRFFK